MPAAPVCRDPPRIWPARNADSLAEHLRDVQAFDVLEANGQARELPGDDGFKIVARHHYTCTCQAKVDTGKANLREALFGPVRKRAFVTQGGGRAMAIEEMDIVIQESRNVVGMG